MVPNSACRMLLAIIGMTNIRKGLRSEAGGDTSMILSTARAQPGMVALKPVEGRSGRGRSLGICQRASLATQISAGVMAVRQRHRMIADVGRPVSNQCSQAVKVAGE